MPVKPGRLLTAADWGEDRARVFRPTRTEGTEPTPTPTVTPTPTPVPTNTPKPPPKTGDSGHPVLWLGLIVLGIAVLCWFRRMERMTTGRKPPENRKE